MITEERLAEVASGLARECTSKCGASVLDKEDSILHGSVAHALGLASNVREVARRFGVDIPLKAPSARAYLEDFATTIGREIAIPRKWGSLARILVVPHEAQHVVQHNAGVDAGWWPRITTHSVLYLAGVVGHTEIGEEYVGKVEGDAYAVTQTVRAYLFGHPAPLVDTLRPLVESYNLLGVGASMAEAVLRSHYATIAAGLVPNVTMARLAHEWLSAHAPDLRGAL